MKRKIFALVIVALQGTASLHAQTTEKKYPSLLWEISGNGLKEPSYLYGTMHVSRKLAFNLSDTFFIALRKCDMVALELNVDDWVRNYYEMELSAMKQEYYNYYRTPSSFYKRGFSLNIPENDRLKEILKSKPYFINNMLYRNTDSKSDFEEDTYLDLFIFQAGKKLNKKITGLEDFKVSLMMVKKSSKPENLTKEEKDKKREEREYKRLLLKDLTQGKSFSEALEDAYRRGDLDMIDSLDNLYYDNPNYNKYMLHERNIIMADRMDSLMKIYKLFTGVGAAHLPGDKGVIELLKLKGYKVRPVMFTNKKSTEEKSKIDDIRYPVNMTREYSPDSVFSADVPGKLYELSSSGGFKSYIHLDMANGSYYYIQRLHYFGKLTGQNEEYFMKRIDSLLYENIPGKILSKKTEKNNLGYPYYDISNKTSKGDMQRYQVHVLPDELIVFKMSGTEEYVTKGKESDQFFNSIKIKQNNGNGTYVLNPSGKEYHISFPVSYTGFESKYSAVTQENLATATDKNDLYLFMNSSLYDFTYIEEDTFELHALAEIFAKQLEYKLVSQQLTNHLQYPAIDVKLNKDSSDLYARIVIKGPDYYFAGVKTTDEQKAIRFYSGLAFKERKYKKPLSKYTDTTLFFSVNTLLNDSEFREITSPENNSYGDYYGYSSEKAEKEKEEEIYLPVTKSKTYVSYESGEKVYVEYKKQSMYYQEKTMDDYWKNKYENLQGKSMMKLRVLNKTEKEGITEINLQLTDTNSTRGIYIKLMQRCGVLYTLKANIDSLTGLTGFQKSFFESFTPKDTCIGVDITSDKLTEHFFNKIYSSDTTEKKRAEKTIEYVVSNLNESHAPMMIKMIQDERFHQLSMSNKTRLMRGLGNIESKLVLPFYEKIYSAYTDSVSIQLAILTGVARQKNTKSGATFLKLLSMELPVSSDKNDIESIFDPFYDSLETAVPLYPALLQYAKYPEYRETVYDLMAQLALEDLLKPKKYSSSKNDILLDAAYDLKIYMSTLQENESSYYNDYYSYRGNETKKFSEKLSEEQDRIYNYTILLAPFYKEGKVNNYFKKVMRISEDNLKLYIACNLLKNNINISDTLWKHYREETSTRIPLFKMLKEIEKTSYFSNSLLVQQDMVQCQLLGSQLSEKISKDKKDTVVFVEKIKMKIKDGKEGYLYVFKSRARDKKVWKLAYSGLHPLDEKDVNLDPGLIKTSVSFEGDTQLKKEIEYAVSKIRIEGRNRASASDFDTKKQRYYSDYDFGY